MLAREEEQARELSELVTTIVLHEVAADRWVWTLNLTNWYLVSSVYDT